MTVATVAKQIAHKMVIYLPMANQNAFNHFQLIDAHSVRIPVPICFQHSKIKMIMTSFYDNKQLLYVHSKRICSQSNI